MDILITFQNKRTEVITNRLDQSFKISSSKQNYEIKLLLVYQAKIIYYLHLLNEKYQLGADTVRSEKSLSNLFFEEAKIQYHFLNEVKKIEDRPELAIYSEKEMNILCERCAGIPCIYQLLGKPRTTLTDIYDQC